MTVTSTYSFEQVSAKALSAGRETDVVALSNGNHAVLGTSGTSQITLDVRNDDGFRVGSTATIAGTDGAVTQLSNGNIVVTSTGAGGGINYTILTASGGFVSSGTNFTGTTNETNSDVAALANGGFVVVDQRSFSNASNPDDRDIKVHIRNANGGSVKTLSVDATTSNDRNACVAGLADGGFAVAFERIAANGSTQMWVAVYNADGTVRKAPYAFDNSGLIKHGAGITALPSGGFAVVYQDDSWGGQPDITYTRFDSLGSAISFTRATSESSVDDEAAVTTLSNGLSLVAFTNDFLGRGDLDIRFTLIDPNTGTVLTDVKNPESIASYAWNESDVSVAALGLARIVASYSASDRDAQERVLQLTRTVTGADDDNDVFIGDEAVDIVHGLGRGDFLSGGANDDTF